jgi:hypothetical protein
MPRKNTNAEGGDLGVRQDSKQTTPATNSLTDAQTQATKSWRDVLSVHPAAELFPLMSEAELKELGEDIKKNGLTSPIVLWQADPKAPEQLLDGRNRLDAIELVTGKPVEIGAPSVMAGEDFLACNRVITLDKSVDPYAYVISANIHRRHLTAEQKRELIVKLLKTTPEKSSRQIAKIVGRSHPHVAKVREELEKAGDVETVTTSIDTKGRKQPTKRKRPPTEDAKKAAVPKPLPAETVVREAVAPDEELALLREFARFVINRARSVSTDPKDHREWKVLLGRVKQVVGAPLHPPDAGEVPGIQDYLRKGAP